MNLYELNQAGYASLPDMTNDDIMKAKEDIAIFLDKYPALYYMLLNHEVKSFTIFTYHCRNYWPMRMAKEIIALIQTFGKLKAIEIRNDMIEFWILDNNDSTCKMYALFDYDRGVIEV